MKNIGKIGSFLAKPSALRIISLLCAILLWFYVSAVESPTSEKNIDSVAVTLRNKDVMMSETGLSVISNSLYEANIVLAGKKSTLNKIDYEDIIATIDLSKLTEAGTYELPISVVAPAGTTVVSTTPRFITVSIDKTVAKSFNIETDIYYSTTYEIGECIITDSQSKALTSATVSGPATDVERISRVVARADFGAITSGVEAKTDLICLDMNGEEITNLNVTMSPKSVIIRQPVYMTKTLPLVASQADNTFSDSQISFSVKPSKVEVKGDPKILNELDAISLDPINEKAVIGEALKNTVNSLIKLPEGVELVDMQNTAVITVSVKNVQKQSFTLTSEDIIVENKPDFLDITFDTPDFKVTLINTSSHNISAEDFEFKLDLTNYISSGIYTVNINPSFKEDIPYAYFLYEIGYPVSFELTTK